MSTIKVIFVAGSEVPGLLCRHVGGRGHPAHPTLLLPPHPGASHHHALGPAAHHGALNAASKQMGRKVATILPFSC